MLSDPKLQHLAELLEHEIARMLEDQKGRVLGYDDVQFDLNEGVVSYFRQKGVMWRARTELIGTYLGDVGVWRWWWYGSDRPVARSPLNAAFAAGQAQGVPTLVSPNPPVHGEKEAVQLANVCAALSHAIGVYRTRQADRLTLYALFPARPRTSEERRSLSSVPPSGAADAARPAQDSVLRFDEPLPQVEAAQQAMMSMVAPAGFNLPPVSPPPMRAPQLPAQSPTTPTHGQSEEVLLPRPVREPPRDAVLPIAKLGLAAVVEELAAGFRQAMIVVDLSVQAGKARFFVLIVAIDHEDNLVAVPTPQGVMEATRDLIAAEARQGSGGWKRLLVRLVNKPAGVAMQTEVRA